MRHAFNLELLDLAKENPSLLLLTGDIGFKVFDTYREQFPDKFINMGVAEANMISVASGLAMSGKKPFVYTIIPFLTMRAFEQIRVDVCIQNQPVKIVGVGGGLAYGALGPTHHSLEDVAILRSLANMTIVTPCDAIETRKAIRAAYEYDGPIYVRLGRDKEPILYKTDYEFKLGKSVTMREGKDATIIASGPILKIALEAADQLRNLGIELKIQNMHTIKPIDEEAILTAAKTTSAIVTLEEHSIIGGLGSAVSEVLAENSISIPFKRIGVQDKFCYEVGSQEYHVKQQGLDSSTICKTISNLLKL